MSDSAFINDERAWSIWMNEKPHVELDDERVLLRFTVRMEAMWLLVLQKEPCLCGTCLLGSLTELWTKATGELLLLVCVSFLTFRSFIQHAMKYGKCV